MKILLSCVNSSVSLVGYDLQRQEPFWYCPGNVLRACGVCVHDAALWVATDNTLVRVDAQGVTGSRLPGPHDNLAHSVKALPGGLLAVADTGNSRVLLLPEGGAASLSLSPLEGWTGPLPADAIHLNDIISWRDGLLASAFYYQPFHHLKNNSPTWKQDGLGVVYYLRRQGGLTTATIVSSGLNCPHSLTEHEGQVYCCSSSTGELYCLTPAPNGTLPLTRSWKVTGTHFLRGCLRVPGGWVLGGSTRRHVQEGEGGGMVLFHLTDQGAVQQLSVAAVGEIYDILPWPENIMPDIAKTLLAQPCMDLEGEFPPPCDYAL